MLNNLSMAVASTPPSWRAGRCSGLSLSEMTNLQLTTTAKSELCTSLFSPSTLLKKKKRNQIKMNVKDNQEQLKERLVANPKPLQVHVQSN